MVFASFRRYLSMRHQSSSKVQALYDYCNNIFSSSKTLAPSSQALQKLSSILDTIQPTDVGLIEETEDDDRGHGFFGINQPNRVARWAQPITYVDIHECDSFTECPRSVQVVPKKCLRGVRAEKKYFLRHRRGVSDTCRRRVGVGVRGVSDTRHGTFEEVSVLHRQAVYEQLYLFKPQLMCIFCFPTSSVIPLHDHPGMTVFSKLLYGSLHVKAYDWVEPPCIIESKGPGYPQVRLAKLAVDKVLTAPCETSVLYPKHGGNLHCFTSVTPCAMLDILSPPYREYEGRKCTYYHDYPYSTFSAGNGPKICDDEEEEYAWLAEIETPGDLYMRQGVYAGPAIQL